MLLVLPVLDVSKRLTSDDRDDLYEAGINPIAKFPAEGIVIFGQKTLQQTASALDRINVRRLLSLLEERDLVHRLETTCLLRTPRTLGTASCSRPRLCLEGVKAQFGIDDFRLNLWTRQRRPLTWWIETLSTLS